MANSKAARRGPVAATLADVARHAGVSRQTVSNVVNGTGRVGDATRAEVLAVVERLGFAPHRGAASLRSGRVDRLAYLLPRDEPRTDNTVLLEFLRHLVSAAAARGQQVLVLQSGSGDLAALDDLSRSRSIDAVVLSGVVDGDARVRHLQAGGVPFACFGRTDPADLQSWVDVDNRAGVRLSTTAALDLGHRAVTFVGYQSTRRWDDERRAGYADAMRRAGLRPNVATVAADDPVTAIERLLLRSQPPTAIVTGSDVLAAAAYAAAARADRVVGRDLSVVGFDGTVAGSFLVPSLATVRIPLDAIAARIVSRLLDDAGHETGDLLDPELVPGDSLGPPADGTGRERQPTSHA